MKLLIDPKKISFFEDSVNKQGERVVEAIIDGIHLAWEQKFYTDEYINEVSDEIYEATHANK